MTAHKLPSVSSRVSRALKKAASRKYSGFTLVELIVVVTILAILATIGFLALGGYSQDAKDAAVKANVRSVYTAISSESAITNNSPRYYVVHDTGAALTGGTVVYVDNSPVVLTGGDWNVSGTNYSAGNPDWAKLKLNPDKFKLSSLPAWLPSAFAAYDSKSVSVGAMDAALAPTASGRNRSASFFQVTGTAPATGLVSVAGNFPSPTPAQTMAGAAAGLVKAPTGTGALVDGGTSSSSSSSSSGGGASKYPGCDANDIYLTGSNQYWAACNVGASNAWTGGVTITNCSAGASDCDSAIRNTLGSYFQWWRNDDVTATTTTATQAVAGTLAGGVGHSNFITNGTAPYDWIATQNGNLWGGGSTSLGSGTFTGQTAGDQTAMKGPCASGYHVPTQSEWWSAISALNGALTNTASWQNDTTLASTLKLPLAGYRSYSSAAYNVQGTYGYYWASSPTGSNGYLVNLSATQVHPANNFLRAYGLSVRCLKN